MACRAGALRTLEPGATVRILFLVPVATMGMVANLLGHHGSERGSLQRTDLERRNPQGGQVAKVSQAW
jgi:hypothetical protein